MELCSRGCSQSNLIQSRQLSLHRSGNDYICALCHWLRLLLQLWKQWYWWFSCCCALKSLVAYLRSLLCVWLHLLWQSWPTLVQEEADTAFQWRCGDALVRRWATNQRSYSHYSRRALHPCGQRLNISICTERCVQQTCELLYTINWII